MVSISESKVRIKVPAVSAATVELKVSIVSLQLFRDITAHCLLSVILEFDICLTYL